MKLPVILVVTQVWFAFGSVRENKYQAHAKQSRHGATSGHRPAARLLLNPKECGVADFAEQAIGEAGPAMLEQHPWTGLVMYYDSVEKLEYQAFGASLLNSRYVLTMAKGILVSSRKWTLRSVRFSEWNIDHLENCTTLDDIGEICRQEYGIEKVIVHPNYNESISEEHHDIAILKTEREVSFSRYVRPICLPFDETIRSMPTVGAKFTVTGWNDIEIGNSSSQRWFANLVGHANDKCEKTYVDTILTDSELCVGGEIIEGFCNFNYGASLLRLVDTVWYLVGMVSIDDGICNTGNPDIYTNTVKYLDWIEKVVNEDNSL